MKGVQYFQCSDNYGSFVRAKNMKVGDFPVRDILDDDDDDEDDDGNDIVVTNQKTSTENVDDDEI